jgi:hypothetical protein
MPPGRHGPPGAAVAHARDIVTTGASSAISPVTAELADLVLRTGHLAYDSPRWTPASGDASRLRDPADLAGSPGDVTAVLAALHHAADATTTTTTTTRIARHDRDTVRQAAADQRLYVPTRLLPDSCDIPYRHGHATSRHITELLSAYSRPIRQ